MMWFKVYGNVLRACVKPGKAIAVTVVMETVAITVAVDFHKVVLAASMEMIMPNLPMVVLLVVVPRRVPVDMVANPVLNLVLPVVVVPAAPVT
jgi:hypothetical protein